MPVRPLRRRIVLAVLAAAFGAGPAWAAQPWSIDIVQPHEPLAGGTIGCLELSCQGDIPLILDGEPRRVRVHAFLDIERTEADLTFEDLSPRPYRIQYTPRRPLRVLLRRDGRGESNAVLAEPHPAQAESIIDDLVVRRGHQLADISVKLAAHRGRAP